MLMCICIALGETKEAMAGRIPHYGDRERERPRDPRRRVRLENGCMCVAAIRSSTLTVLSRRVRVRARPRRGSTTRSTSESSPSTARSSATVTTAAPLVAAMSELVGENRARTCLRSRRTVASLSVRPRGTDVEVPLWAASAVPGEGTRSPLVSTFVMVTSGCRGGDGFGETPRRPKYAGRLWRATCREDFASFSTSSFFASEVTTGWRHATGGVPADGEGAGLLCWWSPLVAW